MRVVRSKCKSKNMRSLRGALATWQSYEATKIPKRIRSKATYHEAHEGHEGKTKK